MKKFMKFLRKPLSIVLAMCMFLSAVTVGLTVWAEDVTSKQTGSEKDVDTLDAEAFKNFDQKLSEWGVPDPNRFIWGVSGDNWSPDGDNSPGGAVTGDWASSYNADAVQNYAAELVLENYSFLENTFVTTMPGNYWQTEANYNLTDNEEYVLTQLYRCYWAMYTNWRAHVIGWKTGKFRVSFLDNGGLASYNNAVAGKMTNGSYTNGDGITVTTDMVTSDATKEAFLTTNANCVERMFLIFSGWTTGNLFDDNSNIGFVRYTSIHAPADYSYLNYYPTLDDIPAAVPTQIGGFNQNKGNGWNKYTVNDDTTGILQNNFNPSTMRWREEVKVNDLDGDTTSKGYLQAFKAVYTEDILAADKAEHLVAPQIAQILNAGEGVFTGIIDFASGSTIMNNSVGDHFIKGGNTYTEGTFTRALRLYKEAKAAVISNYTGAVAKLAPYDHEITIDELDTIYTLLTDADTYYALIPESQKNIVTEDKAFHDYMWAKYNAANDALHTGAYGQNITLLAQKLKNDFVKNTVQTLPVLNDDIAGTVREVLTLLGETMQHAFILGKGANAADLISAIYFDLRGEMSKEELNTYEVRRVVELLGGSAVENTPGEKQIVVQSNPLLYTYNDISEIPAQFTYDRAAIRITYSENGTITEKGYLAVNSETINDKTSYGLFNTWKTTFDEAFMKSDLSTMDITTLNDMKTKATAAVDGLSAYSQETKDHLLKAPDVTMTEAVARIKAIDAAAGKIFCDKVDYIYTTYHGQDMSAADDVALETLMNLLTEAEAIYATLSEAKEDVSVKAAREKLDGLLVEFSGAQNTYNLKVYMARANEMCAWWDFSANAAKPLTQQDVVALRTAIGAVENRYEALSEEQKQTKDVVTMQACKDALAAAVAAFVGNPQWSQTKVDYSDIDNADSAKVLALISKLDGVIDSDLVHNILGVPEGQTFSDFVWGIFNTNVFTGDTVTMLCKLLYPLLSAELIKNEGQVLGIPTTEMLVDHLDIAYTPYWVIQKGCIDSKYKNVYKDVERMGNSGTDSDNKWLTANWYQWDWVDYSNPGNPVPVHDLATFTEALANALAPIWPIVASMLADHDVKFDITIVNQMVFQGEPGYQDVVIPFLNQLGCKNIYDYQTFVNATVVDDANQNRGQALKALPMILNPLENRINEIVSAPITGLMEILPQLAYIINNDWLTVALGHITNPLAAQGFNIVQMLKDAGIDLGDMNKLLKKFLGSVEIAGTPITIPDINFGEIAGIADRVGNAYSPWGIYASNGVRLESNKDELFIYFLRVVFGLVQENTAVITGLVGDNENLVKLVEQAMGNDTDTIINVLFGVLFNETPAPSDNWAGIMNDWKHNKTNVDYGDKLSQAKVEQAIATVDKLVEKIVPLILNMDLSTFVGTALYTDANLSAILKGLYGLLGAENMSVVSDLLNISFSQETVAANLQGKFPAVARAIKAADSWANVNLTDVSWGVSNLSAAGKTDEAADLFALALAQSLKTLNPVLKCLLNGANFPLLNNFVAISGADGYTNAVLPLLNMLGCEGVATAQEYTAKVAENEDNLLYMIIKPVLGLLNDITENPVGTLASKLPNIAFFIDNKGITEIFYNLLLPITNLTDEVLELFKNADGTKPNIFEFIIDSFGIKLPFDIDFHDIDGSILGIVTDLLANLKIGDLTLNINVTPFDWGTIAGHGDKKADQGMWERITTRGPSTYHIQADSGGMVFGLLSWVFQLVKDNQTMILELITTKIPSLTEELKKLITDLLTAVLANDAPVITNALIRAIALEDPTEDDWDMTDFAHNAIKIVYKDEDVDSRRAAEAAAKTDLIISKVIPLITGKPGGLTTLFTSNVYTDNIISTLFKLVYPNVAGGAIASVMSQLGIDVTMPTLIKTFTDAGYTAVADEISRINALWNDPDSGVEAGDWSALDVTKLVWNVDDADSFANALAVMLTPFYGVLNALLANRDFVVLDAYTIKGANGYKTAVLPIFGALGCTNDTVLSADDFAEKYDVETPDTKQMLKDIIVPLLKHVESITANPITMLSSILPNLAYFMDNHGLTRSVMNLLRPVTNITDSLLPLFKDKDGKVPELLQFVSDILTGVGVTLPGGLELTNIEDTLLPFIKSFLKDIEIKPAVYQLDEDGNQELDPDGNPIVITPAVKISIDLIDFEWGTIAGRGTLKTDADAPFFAKLGIGSKNYKYVEANKGDMITALLNYIFDNVKKNEQTVMTVLDALMADAAQIKDILHKLLLNNSQDITEAIIKVLTAGNYEILDDEWDMTDFTQKAYDAVYREDGDITSKEVEGAVDTIDKALNKFLPMLLPDGIDSLGDFINGVLYTDEMVNKLFLAVYGAIGAPDVLDIMLNLGFDLSTAAVGAKLEELGYTAVAAAVKAADAWADVDLTGVSWNVTDGATFANAVSAMFSPFNELLEILLVGRGDTYNLLDMYEIAGANGYRNSILPLLAALGCNGEDGLKTADEFEALESSQLISEILQPIMNYVERIAENPASTLGAALPNLAFFMQHGGLTRSVKNLLKPITNIADSLLPLFKDEATGKVPDFFEFISGLLGGTAILPDGVDLNDLESSIVPLVNSFLKDITVVKEVKDDKGNITKPAVKITIELPDIEWYKMAACGELKTNAEAPFYAKLFGSSTKWKYVEAHLGDAVITLLNYVAKALIKNKDEIHGLVAAILPDTMTVDQKAKITAMVDQLLTNKEEDIASGIIAILSPKAIIEEDWDMGKFIFEAYTHAFGDGIDAGRVNSAVTKADRMINEALAKFLGTNLTELITTNLYTDKMVTTVFKAVLPALSGDSVKQIMDILDFKVSVADMAAALAEYPGVASVLNGAATWADVDFDALVWGVSNADGFADALAAMFSPFNDVLKALFIGEDYTLAGAYNLKGANGYKNAIVPILGALGCTTIKSADEFKTDAMGDANSMLKNIVKPILDLVSRIAAAPIDTLATILPNLAYFMDNNGLTKSVMKLLAPLDNIIEEVIRLVSVKDAEGNYPSTLNFIADLLPAFITIPDNINIKDLEHHLVPLINSFLKDLVIIPEVKDEAGNVTKEAVKITIELPTFEWGHLAGIGGEESLVTNADAPFWAALGGKGYKSVVITTDEQKGASANLVLTYIFKVLTANKTQITKLVDALLASMDPPLDANIVGVIKSFLEKLLNNSPENIVAALVKAIDLQDLKDEEWDMSGFAWDVYNAAGNGEYDVDVDSDRTQKAIGTLDDLINKLLPMLMGDENASLAGLVSANLYTDKMVSTIFTALYKALGADSIAKVFDILELDVSVPALQAALTANGYDAVAAALEGKAWADVDLTDVAWGINGDKAKFADALATILTPFNDVLSGLLTGADYKLAGIYELKGNNGYADSVLPLLAALGCNDKDGLLTASAYKAALEDENSNSNTMMINIINPLLNFVERVCGDPVEMIASILPNLAYFLDNNGLTKAVTYLIKPVTNILDQIIPLVADEVDGKYPSAIDFAAQLLADLGINIPYGLDIKDLENEGTLRTMLNDLLKAIKINGVDYGFTVPEFSWAKLAGCGTVKTTEDAPFYAKLFGSSSKWKYVEANKGDSAIVLLNFVAKVLKANDSTIISLVKSLLAGVDEATLSAAVKDKIISMLTNLLTRSPEAISGAIIKVLALEDVTDDGWDIYTFLQKVTDVAYAEDIDSGRVVQAIDTADKLIKNVLSNFMNIDLDTVISDKLYTDSLVTTIFKALYGALGGASDIMSKLGIDVSVSAVAEILERNGYAEVAAAITGKTWDEIKNDSEFAPVWGIAGSAKFANALAAILVPFNGVLGALLADQDYKVLDAYTIKGANGYKNSVVPLLGALGCEDIKTPDEYIALVAGGSETAMMENIINPVLGLVGKIAGGPLTTLADILPNLAFFLDNGGLTKAIGNLLKPIENITDKLLPLISADGSDTSLMGFVSELLALFGVQLPGGIDIKDLENEENLVALINSFLKDLDIKGTKYTFVLPEFSWEKLAGCGTLVENADAPYLAKVFGTSAYKHVESDPGDTMMTVITYLAKVIKANEDSILSLVSALLADVELPLDLISMITRLIKDNTAEELANAIIRVLAARPMDPANDDDWDMTDFIEGVYKEVYNHGLTEDKVENAVKKTDLIISKVLEMITGGDLSGLIATNLYTDKMATTIFDALYKALGSEKVADIIKKLEISGLDISVDAVAANMRNAGFTDVADAITAADSLTGLTLTWNISTSADFAKAIAAIAVPFNDVLKALLLNGSEVKILDSYVIEGANGYKTAILPLLAALGCNEEDNLLTADEFATVVNNENASDTAMLEAIINPVLHLVDRIAVSPIKTLASIMPNLAYFIENHGITRAVNNLIKPISNIADDIIPLLADKDNETGKYPTLIEFAIQIIGSIDSITLPDWIDLTDIEGTIVNALESVLSNLTINGKVYNFTLPSINWKNLIGCGEIKTNAQAPFYAKIFGGSTKWKYVEADTNRSTLMILNYIMSVVTTNKDRVTALITDVLAGVEMDQKVKDKLIEIVGKLLSNDPDLIVAALIKTLDPAAVANDDWDMTAFVQDVYDATKESGIDEGRTTRAITNMDTILNGVVKLLGNAGVIPPINGKNIGSLTDIINAFIYSDTLPTLILKNLYPILNGADVAPILSTLGFDVSIERMAAILSNNGFTDAANAITGKTWDEIKNDAEFAPKWNITDSAGIAKAVSALLVPFNGVLGALLAGQSYTLLGAYEIKGAIGYQNSIQPLFAALGCSDDSMKTSDEFIEAVKGADADSTIMMEMVLTPIFKLLDKVAANPATTLTQILPNLAYFMNNGGLTRAVFNLIKPIENIAAEIMPLISEKGEDGKYPSLVDFALELLKDLGIFNIDDALPDGVDITELEKSIVPIVNYFLKGKEGTGIVINGQTILLQLNDIDWAQLAGCGTVVTNADAPFFAKVTGASKWSYVESNPADAFVCLLNYLTGTIAGNSTELIKLLNSVIDGIEMDAALKETIKTYIGNLLASDSATLTKALINLLALDSIPDDDWDMSDLTEFAWKLYDAVAEGQYGSDIDPDRVNEAIDSIDGVISNVLNNFMGGKDLASFINGALYTDSLVTTLFNALYGVLAGAQDTMKIIGFDVSVENIAAILERNGFNAVADAVKDGGFTVKELAWGIDGNGETFAKAIATMLVPFNALLKGLLVGDGYTVADIYTISGANGYKNSVLPLLGALGCKENVLSAGDFKDKSGDSETSMMENVLAPILSLIERIAAAPISTLSEIMPNIAYFMDTGSLNRVIMNLIKPVTNITDEILPIITKEEDVDLINFVQELLAKLGVTLPEGLDLTDIANSIIPLVNSILAGEDGTGIVIGGQKILLKLNDIDWAKLAGCGELKVSDDAPFLAKAVGSSSKWRYVEADKADALIVILNYIMQNVKDNQDAITALISSLLTSLPPEAQDVINSLIKDILANDAKEITAALVKVLTLPNLSNVDWDMTQLLWNWREAAYYYSDMTSQDVEDVVNSLDSLLSTLLPELAGTDISGLINGKLYTSSMVSTIAQAAYRALGSGTLASVMGTIGINITIDDVKTAWAAYPSAVDALNNATSWADADLSAVNWNVTNGDSFAKAMGTVFAPFSELLGALLVSKDFNVAGTYTIKGADGYKNAVMPILGALGCTELLSDSDYKAQFDKDPANAVANIIKPITALLDKVAAKPISTLMGILPNLAAFMDNNGLTESLGMLLAPLDNVADQILNLVPAYSEKYDGDMLKYVLGLLGDLNIINVPGLDLENIEGSIIPMVKKLLADGITISGQTFSIALPDFTWGAIAGHGAVVENAIAPYVAKVASGSTNYKYIEANKGDTTMALLNYVFDAVKANQDLIFSLLGNVDQAIKDIIVKVLSNPSAKISGALIKLFKAGTPGSIVWGEDFIWNFAGVMYPSGTNAQRVSTSITTADKAIKNALSAFLNMDLNSLAGGAIYSNSLVSTIVKGLYGAVGGSDLAGVMNMLGLDFSLAGVASELYNYPEAMAAIASAGSWADVNFTNVNWNATTPNGFANALAAALRPLNPVLRALLAGDTYSILGNGIVINGADGYRNAVYPLLTTLGCNTALNPDQYRAAVNANPDNMIAEIIKPITALISKVCDKPLETLASILPNIAYFINNNGVMDLVDALILPVTNIVTPILDLLGEDSLIDFVLSLVKINLPIDINNIRDSLVPMINSIIGNLEISGKKLGVQLSPINWGTLAGHGSLRNNGYINYVEADVPATMVALLRYVFGIVSYGNNANAIKRLVGNVDIVNQIIGNIAKANNDDLVRMVVDILAPLDKNLTATYVYRPIKPVVTTYTTNLTEENFADAVDLFDAMIPELIASLAGGGTLHDLLANNLFTTSMMTTIASAVFGLLTPEKLGMDVIGLLAKVGFDISPNGVASMLTESKYSALRGALAGHSQWSQIKFDSLKWGFANGDQDGFIGQLVALIRPILPVLKYVLGAGDLVVLDSVTFKGANGYNNAIIPLLEALDCKNIMSVAEYNKRANANPDNVVLSITSQLLQRINELLERPVDTLAQILPNLAYFMYNNGIKELADGILLPITDLLNTIEPVYKVNLDLSMLDNFDLVGTVNGLLGGIKISGQPLGIKLLDFKWEDLAGRGTPTRFQSQRLDEGGRRVTATRIEADKPAVLVTVLRFVVSILQDPGNLESIKALLAGLDLGSVADIVGMILDMLATEDKDVIIEFIFSLLFGMGAGGEENEDQPDVPTVTEPQPENKGANVPLIVGLSVGGALLLALGLWWLLVFLRKKKEGQQTIDATLS